MSKRSIIPLAGLIAIACCGAIFWFAHLINGTAGATVPVASSTAAGGNEFYGILDIAASDEWKSSHTVQIEFNGVTHSLPFVFKDNFTRATPLVASRVDDKLEVTIKGRPVAIKSVPE